MNNGAVVKAIKLSDIPSFDTDDAGTPAVPEKDYLFSATAHLDSPRQIFYFSVYNLTTAGNANADRALFRYNLSNGKLELLVNEAFSTSFGDIHPSNDGNYLVFTEASHLGLCANKVGLGIYDLKNKKSLGQVLLPMDTVGSIEFDRWITNQVFSYKNKTYSSMDECLKDDSGTKPQITPRMYTILPNPDSFHIQGHVRRGQILRSEIGQGLVFQLLPTENGWRIDVNLTTSRVEPGFADVTPPWHGINDLDIEGWHFRNAGNTAPNDGSVKAPQKTREFIFALNEKDMRDTMELIQKYTSGKLLEIPLVPLGRGALIIKNLELGNLVPNSQAWIESMDFTVDGQFSGGKML